MVCECAPSTMRAGASSEQEPAPETWTEMRREARDLLLFVLLLFLLLLILLEGVPFLFRSPKLLELRRHRPLHDFLSDLRHWLIHELLRSTIHHALLWCSTYTFHSGLQDPSEAEGHQQSALEYDSARAPVVQHTPLPRRPP